MKDWFLLDNLKDFIYREIANSAIFRPHEIIIFLDDGTKAKITTIF